MRFSVWPSSKRPWAEIQSLACHAEATGWYGFWFEDHYMPNTADGAVADGPALECWSVLAGVASAVPRLRIGSLVSPTTVHHPALLAKQAATIDRMSDGRFVLGLGAGWQVNEHRAYGFELLEPGPRVSRFAEAIEIIQSMLRAPRTTYAGEHFRVADAPCDPKPVQDPLPVMVGSGSPRMLRLTARFADEWNSWGTPDEISRRLGLLTAACEKEGRDPALLRKSSQALVSIVDNPVTAAKISSGVPADRSLVGPPEQLVDQLGRYGELGIDEFIVPDFIIAGSDSAEARRDGFNRFKDDVIAKLG